MKKQHLIKETISRDHYITYCGLIKHFWGWVDHVRDIETTTCKACKKSYERRKAK